MGMMEQRLGVRVLAVWTEGYWMLRKSGIIFYVMDFFDLIQLGHDMLNY